MKYLYILLLFIGQLPVLQNYPALAEQANLTSMTGTWTGSGFVRPKLFDGKQSVRCKLKATVLVATKTILAGRCATASRSLEFRLDIIHSENGKKIKSIARISGNAQALEFYGRKSRSGFVMKIANPIERDGRTLSFELRVSLPDRNKLTISETVTDIVTREKVDALAIALTR
jgi:hypothetical protein